MSVLLKLTNVRASAISRESYHVHFPFELRYNATEQSETAPSVEDN